VLFGQAALGWSNPRSMIGVQPAALLILRDTRPGRVDAPELVRREQKNSCCLEPRHVHVKHEGE
jgi:hypothetical protein